MESEKIFYHLFANGDDAKGFITSETDSKAAFNRFGICAYYSGATVMSFSIEESHPHGLLHGTFLQCSRFKFLYETLTKHYIVSTRGSLDGVHFECEMYPIRDVGYLRNVGTYTIVQPTKDGKSVMPYDYFWGTGSMYFRDSNHIPIWQIDNKGNILEVKTLGDYSVHRQRHILHSKKPLPPGWKVCNGILLPDNYVNVVAFESIYQTYNCFRVFLCNNKQRQEEVARQMAEVRGVMIEDGEARALCSELCRQTFGFRDPRRLNPQERLSLALSAKRLHHLSIRQIATIVRLPREEIAKYL